MMVVLVHGFWLGAWAWDTVRPALETAGHVTNALTLPGLHPDDTDRASISLEDHIDAVVAAIDAETEPVVLVGHSAGGAVAHAAAARRPGRVARVVHVDTWPAAEGRCIADSLPQENGEIPLPPWDMFDEEDLVGLDDPLRALLRSRAVPQPARTATDTFSYAGTGRLSVPTTVIACEFSPAQLQEWAAGGAPNLAELASLTDLTWMHVPTGHWPMLTKPAELAAALVSALA
ncbi:MAG: esterase/lipase family protein [Acidimicrobiales bacterium]